MYIFTIKASDAFGHQKMISLKANGSNEALELLRQQGFHAQIQDILEAHRDDLLSKLKSLKIKERLFKIPAKDIQRLIKLMGSSLSRGKTLKNTLQFIGENEDSKLLKRLIDQLLERMSRPFGSQVEIFADFPQYFEEEFLGIVEAGESSSNLGEYLLDYAAEKRKQHQLTSKFKGILLKRSMTFGMVILVAIVVVAFVIPQFKALFGADLQIPWAMTALLNISGFIIDYGLYLFTVLVVLGATSSYLVLHHVKVRFWWHDLLLNLPVLGRTLKTYYTAQFSYFLSTLLTKNVDIIRSMNIIIKQTKNVCMVMTYQNLIRSMQAGDDLFAAIVNEAEQGRHYLVSSIVQAAKVGAETASLGATLMDVRNDLEELLMIRLNRSIKVFSFIFYGLIILMAMFIAYAIGSAIVAFYNNAQSLV